MNNRTIKRLLCFMILFVIISINSNIFAVTLVIDPGHGGIDTGAVASNGTYERDLNLKIAKYLKEYLDDYDLEVYMTHEGNVTGKYELIDRALYSRSLNPDMVLSVHLNSSNNTENIPNGAEVWVTENKSLPKYNQNSTELGNKILENLSELGIKNLGVKTRGGRSDPTDVYSDGTSADYYGIICYNMRGCKIDAGVISPNGTTPANIQNGEGVPAIIVEHCYVVGSDIQFVDSEEDLKKIALADGKAIVDYYGLELKSDSNEEKIEINEAGNDLPFEDVSKDKWYYNAIDYVYSNNIIKGYDKSHFGPEDVLTRGQLVTVLYRMEGEQPIEGTPIFPDVQDSSKYYYKAIKWATDNKIVSGYNTGFFGPNDIITREQLAVILNKYAKFKEKDVSQSDELERFSDVDQISGYALNQIKWAVGAGVISGNKNGTLNPKGQASRAEVSAMIEKYCKKIGI